MAGLGNGKVGFIWSVADLLRGDFKAHEYGSVILPFTVLRRLEQVLAPTREKVWNAASDYAKSPAAVREKMLLKAAGAGRTFYNTSKLDFARLTADPAHIAQNLTTFVHGFSANARDIFENFRFEEQIARLDGADLLFLVVQKFASVDFHPERVSNHEMGGVFEELIRKFAEASNETAGEHFTPREVIKLMVNLLFAEDDDALRKPGIVRTMYDPACGTGGMLSVAEEYLSELNPDGRLQVFGQELNPESYAICKSDMLIKGQDAENIKEGNSFSEDGLPSLKADYLISNPPFGVDWTKAEKVVREEHEQKGFAGRFGPGLPRKNDGALLFLLHMMSKMKPREQGGSRLAIVFNGSPLFTGGAGSGESEIRRYLFENDLLEAVIALPDQLFYNTGISTYVWIVTNRKSKERRGKVQLVNGVKHFRKLKPSLGDKRNELGPDDIKGLTRLYHDFREGSDVKVFPNEAFGFNVITVERPLRLNFQASAERIARLDDEAAWCGLVDGGKQRLTDTASDEGRQVQADMLRVLGLLDGAKVYRSRTAFMSDLMSAAKKAVVSMPAPISKAVLSALSERDETSEVCRDSRGNQEPDVDLRDTENVPLGEEISEYMIREVLPHAPEAWVDHAKTRVGYEIPLTRHFYECEPPRPLEVIEKEILELEAVIAGKLSKALR